MTKTKAFQVAIEELSKQNGLNAFRSASPPNSSASSTSTSSTVSSKNHKCIPENLDLENVFNPKYNVIELISTQKKPRKQLVRRILISINNHSQIC
jgi:hypothetical protein